LGTVQYEGNSQVFVGRDYGSKRAYSEDIAYQIDSEVRRIMGEAHDKAREIIMEHRSQLNLIAEKLLELETLDEKTIKSLFETGLMPAENKEYEFPRESAASFDEAKRAREKKEAQRAEEQEQAEEKRTEALPEESTPSEEE